MTKVITFSVLIFFISLPGVLCLDCYVCENQEDNNGKCVNTIKPCESHEDVCLTEIKWGSTPYWSQGAKKQYYISKSCSNKTECPKRRQRNMPFCTYIWYQDWVCSECCLGDKCNYYIMSGSRDNKPVFGVLIGLTLLHVLYRNVQSKL